MTNDRIIMTSPRGITLPDSREMRNWEGLTRAVEQAGGTVERMPESFDSGSYLETWTRDTAFILNGVAYMPDPEIVAEDVRLDQIQLEPVLKAQGYEVVYVQGAYFEGGDILVDPQGQKIFMGTDTDNAASPALLEKAINETQAQDWSMVPVPTEGTDGSFYHLDTFMGILPNGEVMLYGEGALDDGASIRAAIDPERIIPVTEEQALALGTNFAEVNDTVILTNDDLEIRSALQERGYEVIMPADVGADSFQVGRGGAHCLTNTNTSTIEPAAPAPAPVNEPTPVTKTALQPPSPQ
jgi:N-dimethylarginine dimethylaminohydrolase